MTVRLQLVNTATSHTWISRDKLNAVQKEKKSEKKNQIPLTYCVCDNTHKVQYSGNIQTNLG